MCERYSTSIMPWTPSGKANSGDARTERATRHFLDVLAEAMTTKMTFPTSRMTLNNADGLFQNSCLGEGAGRGK